MSDGPKRARGAKIKLSLAQSIMAALFIMVSFLVVSLFQNDIWVASLGASAFIAFAFPAADSASPRCLVGGYVTGAVWGVLCSYGRQWAAGFMDGAAATIALCVLAVFLTALFMSLFDMQHPPSAALSIGITMADQPLGMAAAAIGCIIVLSALNRLWCKYYPGREK